MRKLLHAIGVTSPESGAQHVSVGKKLLFPITGGMVAFFLILAGGIYWQYTENYKRQTRSELAAAATLYRHTVAEYQTTMIGIVELLASDTRVSDMLQRKDADGLLGLYKEAFLRVQQSSGLNYLLFADNAHDVIVRIHQPDDRGDRIRRESFVAAEQGNMLVSTFDVGSDGRLSLRMVAPILPGEEKGGFIEVGMEMERVLVAVARPENIDLILALDKRHIDEKRVHFDPQKSTGHAFWVDAGDRFLLYTTFAGLSPDFTRNLLQGNTGSGLQETGSFSLTAHEKQYEVNTIPLADSTGNPLGSLFIIQNATHLQHEFIVVSLILLGTVLFVATIIRWFVARRLRTTDASFTDMENAIEEGERIFESVFSESDTGFILRTSVDGTVIKANAAALSAFSAGREEDIDTGRLVPVPAAGSIQQVWKRPLFAIGSDESRFFEMTLLPMGSNADLECIALREVTDGVLLQSENRAHITFLRTVINLLPGWVCIKDSALRLTQTNNVFNTVFGRGNAPVNEVRHSDWLGAGMDTLLEADRKALHSGQPVVFELKIPLEDGEHTYLVTKQRFTGRNGQMSILSTGNDITERVRMVEELVVLHRKAEEAGLAKTRFLARMSHELHTPMNAVVGMSYLSLKLAPEGPLHEYLANIQKSAEKLLKIIADILDFSEMETGKVRLENSVFNLADELETIETQVRPLLAQKPVEFFLEVSGADGQFMGDVSRIRQALLILCDNAVKFTEKGAVRLSCVVTEKSSRSCEIRFAVEDTGIGIADEHLNRLFDNFHQVDGGMTRQHGGIGLGLAIARQVVSFMGGILEAASVPGNSSRFSFTVTLERPVKDKKTHSGKIQSQTGAVDEEAFPQARILVVEDDALNQEIVSELLLHVGLHVEIVDDGKKAVEIVREQSFDLVLMDLQMPVMGGVEAAKLIRDFEAETAAAQLPIIALTANTRQSDRSDCAEAGMNGFLCKPIDVDELYATLKQWLIKDAT